MSNKKEKYVFENTPSQKSSVTSTLSIKTVNTMGVFKSFYKMPFTIYSEQEPWVSPFWSEMRDFFKKNQLFWSHTECQLFIAYRNDEPVGRIAAIIDHSLAENEKTTIGFFGFFECIDDFTVAKELMDIAKKWLKKQGMKEMHGPVDGRVDVGSGFVFRGFDSLPYLLGHYSKPYYIDFMEQYSMEKEKDLVSYHIDLTKEIPSKVKESAKRCEQQGISVRKFNRFRYNKEMKWWIPMLLNIFSHHWGYTSSSEEEVKERFGIKQLRWIVNPNLFLIAEHERHPIGFRWSLPDYNQIFKEMNGKLGLIGMIKVLLTRQKKITRGRFIIMGIMKQYQGMGIGTFLNYHTLVEMKRQGYECAEYGWIDENNIASCKAGEKIGGEVYKIYRVYKTKL